MNATRQERRIEREKRTVEVMIGMYCRAHHGSSAALCADCSALLDYALARIERCPFLVKKPPCSSCPVHCYKPEMREQIRAVMRHAGPRMLLSHPVLAVAHLVDGIKKRDLANS